VSGSQLLEEKLGAATGVVEHYVADESVEAVYLSGSLMAGLGTPFSDTDVFVITDGAPSEAVQHGAGADRVDVEFRSVEWLDQVTALARPYSSTMYDNQALTTPPGLIDDAVRLRVGHDLKPSPRLTAVRAALDDGDHNLRKLLVSQLAADSGAAWMDALGFLSNGDLDSAGLVAQKVLLIGLDAACAAAGDLYRGGKWVWSRVRRDPVLADAVPWLRDLLLEPAARPTLRRLLAAQEILAFALHRTWYPQRPIPVPTEPPYALDGLVRSPYWMPFSLAAGFYLSERGARHFTAPDLALACWAGARGRSRAEIERQVATVRGDEPELIRQTIDALRAIGAIGDAGQWESLFRSQERG